MARRKVVVVGAGMGGLAAAITLAARGCDVSVLERATVPGGKARRIMVDGQPIAGGPTVFTMRWIFDGLLEEAGVRLDDILTLTPADVLARHAWTSGGRLDLYADIERSVDAISAFAGAKDGAGYRNFCARAKDIFQTLLEPFIAIERAANPLDLTWRAGFSQVGALLRTAPMKTMWGAIGEHFADPRLQQLFGRYATYCGSSPFLAPATLMLVAHVEQDGVWLVDGGMHQVAAAMAEVATRSGASISCDAHVKRIDVRGGRVTGVTLQSGEHIACDAVVFNGDVGALADGLLGNDVTASVRSPARAERSLSAVTWCAHVPTGGFPLHYHSVFFADDYQREFDAILGDRSIRDRPTVYICAEDRGGNLLPRSGDAERMLILINAPPDGDRKAFSQSEIASFAAGTRAVLEQCGLEVGRFEDAGVITAPDHFNALFPATGGALYGRASHGANASFDRQATLTKIAGLYCAGGSAHPGPGVPMATLSGRIAAARVIEDLDARDGKRRPRYPLSVPVPKRISRQT